MPESSHCCLPRRSSPLLGGGPGQRGYIGTIARRVCHAYDAHAVVVVALRTRGLRQLQIDEDLAVLRLLDRRDELTRSRAQILNRCTGCTGYWPS